MSSWWSTRGVLDGLDLEENSIVARVIQAVGLFGDILSTEDTLGSSDEEDGVSGSSDDEEEDSAPESSAPDCVLDREPDSSERTATGGLAAEEKTGVLAPETENTDDAPKSRERKNPEVRTEGEQRGHVYKVDEDSKMPIGKSKEVRTEEEREEYVEKGGDEKVHGGQMARAEEEEVEQAENGEEEMSKEEVEEEGGERGEKGEDSVCRGVSESWNEEAERGTEMERNSEEVVGQEGQDGEMVNEGGRTREDQAELKEEVEEGGMGGNGREKEIQMEREEEGEERGAGKERGSGRGGDEVRREEGGVEEEEEEEGREGAEQVEVTKERGSGEEEDGSHAEISCCPEISPPGGEISCCPEISSCCPETSPPGGEKTERKEKQVEKREVIIVGREEGEEVEEEAGQVMERTDKVEKDCKVGEREQESKATKAITEMPAGEGTMEERREDKEGERERGKTAGEEVNPAVERADSDSCQSSSMMQQQRDSDTESSGVSNEASDCTTGQGSEVTRGPCPKNVGAAANIHSGTGVCPASPSSDNKREDTLSGVGGSELDAPAQPTHTQQTAGPESHGETTVSPQSAARLDPSESAQAVVPSHGSGDAEPDTQPSVAPGELETRLEGNQQEAAEHPDVTDLSQQPGETTASLEDQAKDIPPEKTVRQEEASSDSTSTPLDEKVTPMDATGQSGTGTGQGDKQARPAQNSTGQNPPEPNGSAAAEEKKEEEEQASGSHELENGETAAVDDDDDTKDGSQPTSKYKTVSYRRIRKGNTKQRIDEFESFMPS